jgi:hypothetical protein
VSQEEYERTVVDVPVVGFAYTGLRPTHGKRYVCLPCPTNPHDACAIGVYDQGIRMGFLTKDYNRDLIRYFSQSVPRLMVIEFNNYITNRSAPGLLCVFRCESSDTWPTLGPDEIRVLPCNHLSSLSSEPLCCDTCQERIKAVQLPMCLCKTEPHDWLLAPSIDTCPTPSASDVASTANSTDPQSH